MKSKNIKRIISMVIMLTIVCSLVSCAKVAKFVISIHNFIYTEVEDGYEIGGIYQGMAIFAKAATIDGFTDLILTIPSEHNGKPVVSIADNAFKDYAYLYKIDIPDTVKKIGNNAFQNCTFLTECVIPNSVTEIGDNAFNGCIYLKDIVIPDSVTTIGDYAFYSSACYINEENGKELVDTISDLPFSRRELLEVNIPASVTSIGVAAFGLATSIKGFKVDENNPYYKSIDGVLYTKDEKTLVQYPISLENEDFNLPDSVENIEDYAFAKLRFLVNMNSTENSNLKRVGNYAFYKCEVLESVHLEQNIEFIGDYAFAENAALQGLNWGNAEILLGEGVINKCYMLGIIFYGGTMNQFERLIESQKPYLTEKTSRSRVIYCSNGYLFLEVNGDTHNKLPWGPQ